jgi:two-component system response regulator FlrC
MPGALDGVDVLRKAKADQPELEVIVLTAHGTVDTAVDAMKLGAFDYLQKPLGSPAELRLIVARAMERRHLLSMQDAVARLDAPLPPLSYGDTVMVSVLRGIEKVAPTNANVLLLGESGTGKEVAARTIHRQSRRAGGPFIAVNCAAISDNLMESEISGHEKGAFTGATAARRGRLELADGGTMFLDEIGELKLELQAKLLRVIQMTSHHSPRLCLPASARTSVDTLCDSTRKPCAASAPPHGPETCASLPTSSSVQPSSPRATSSAAPTSPCRPAPRPA